MCFLTARLYLQQLHELDLFVETSEIEMYDFRSDEDKKQR